MRGFSTREVDGEDRVEFWREMICHHFVPLRVEPLTDGAFDGRTALRSVGPIEVACLHARPMLAARTERHIAGSAGEYFVAVHLHGVAEAEQDGRRATLRPGDFALFDSSRPYKIAFRAATSFDHLILRVPREELDRRASRLDRATAVAVPAGSVAGRLTAPVLRTLATVEADASYASPILDLIATSLARTTGLTAAPTPRHRQALAELQRYTLTHLANDLTPARVASACFCSPRQLHRLFARQGTTFGTFLKTARLERVADDLTDPALHELTIAEIARRYGYRHAATLSRDFTERFGTSPRAFRTLAANRPRTPILESFAANTEH